MQCAYHTSIADEPHLSPSTARRLRGLASSALLLALLAALVVLDRADIVPSVYRIAPGWVGIAVYALVGAAAVVSALVVPKRRRDVLLVAGIAAMPLALGPWALVLAGYVVLSLVLARLRLPIVVRFLIAFAAWLAVPVLRVHYLDVQGQADTILLAQLWVGMLYATLYLIVERARALPGETSTLRDDAFYLVSPPRFVVPFFQPISPRQVIAAQRNPYPKRLLARAAWLACYALLLGVAVHLLDRAGPHLVRPLQLVAQFGAHYGRAAQAIILAIAVFRLLGFDLAAGFRFPFLSRSFAEFFRRYNHYVRDAVLSLFYFPILGHLRTRWSRRVASIVAAFVAILVGSLALQDLLIPAGISLHPLGTIENLLRPHRIVAMVALWALIVFPNAGFVPRPRPPMAWPRVALQIAIVDVVYVLLWYLETR